PLRIQIEGPLISIQKLLPTASGIIDVMSVKFPQPVGPELAGLAFRKIYNRDSFPEVPGDMVVLDEYLGWVIEKPMRQIDYYGVTFDPLVPPEVLQININEIDDDGGEYANTHLLFPVNPAEYTGKKVLAVPRCCQKRKGTQDRRRMNGSVVERESRGAPGVSEALPISRGRLQQCQGLK
ncbi:hypothetical protein F5883DRAFT_435311, partial [Diaporthe sp. PMI_573]